MFPDGIGRAVYGDKWYNIIGQRLDKVTALDDINEPLRGGGLATQDSILSSQMDSHIVSVKRPQIALCVGVSMMEPSPKIFLIDPILSTVGLKERFTDDNADVVFTRETDKTFSAHRAVLSVSSSVFFKMFKGEWKERNAKGIFLPDTVDFEAFSAALSLVYGIQVSVEKGRLPELYKIADRYDLACVKIAIAMGIPGWSIDLIIDMCLLATQFDSKCLCNAKIMQACVDFFVSNFHFLSNEEEAEISKLPYEVMMKVVQSDELNVSSELEVWQVLVKWTTSSTQ